MKKIYDVVIVGGGASGLLCASALSKKFKIAILEKDTKIGKKILATGNGRCNLTNTNMSSKYYNQNIDTYLNKFNSLNTIKYFNKLGLLTYADNEGRVYPTSNSATSVLDILRFSLSDNVSIFCEKNIQNITKNDIFELKTDKNEVFYAKKIVYTCGGNSLHEIENLHKDLIPFKKSLVSLRTDYNKFLNNIRVSDIKATLKLNNQEVVERGEILFKDNAISGIMIFNLSSYMARINNYEQNIVLDFLPDITEDKLYTILTDRQGIQYLTKENCLTGIFHSALCKNIIDKINNDTQNINKLVRFIKHYNIKTYAPLDNNQVFSGGVSLHSLKNSLESIYNEGLYFAGECIDVDGICGGYNLQWAWTSAYIVANDINNNL